jgi:hypothetical protein
MPQRIEDEVGIRERGNLNRKFVCRLLKLKTSARNLYDLFEAVVPEATGRVG